MQICSASPLGYQASMAIFVPGARLATLALQPPRGGFVRAWDCLTPRPLSGTGRATCLRACPLKAVTHSMEKLSGLIADCLKNASAVESS